jgi:hypothetical protein
MNYEEIETQSFGITQKHIVLFDQSDGYVTFPADESNPEYIKFLEALDAEEE